jgi:beta-N-acetylhexosaminidase
MVFFNRPDANLTNAMHKSLMKSISPQLIPFMIHVFRTKCCFSGLPAYIAAIILFLNPLNSHAQSPSTTIDEMIGQMIMIGFRGDTIKENDLIVEQITKYQPGGVILFDYDVPSKKSGRNISSPDQTKQLISGLKKLSPTPMFIAVDYEGGKVNRLKEKYGFPRVPGAADIGAMNQTDSALYYANQMANTLKETGFNMNMAPVTDVNVYPDCPVIGALGRSFSGDPETVAHYAQLFCQAYSQAGIIPVIKHFPGHGSSRTDSHNGFTDISGTWQPDELIPYFNLAKNPFVPAVMTAHVFLSSLDENYPATLSHRIITEVLRDNIGFNGMIISDDMNMGAIRDQFGLEESILLAIGAGVDLLVFSNNGISYDPDLLPKVFSTIKQAVQSGSISEERIKESYNRIIRVKRNLAQSEP